MNKVPKGFFCRSLEIVIIFKIKSIRIVCKHDYSVITFVRAIKPEFHVHIDIVYGIVMSEIFGGYITYYNAGVIIEAIDCKTNLVK